jgi:hypothetical protein
MNSQTLHGLELSELAFEDAWLQGDEESLRSVMSTDVVITDTDGTRADVESLLAHSRTPAGETAGVTILHRRARQRGELGTTCLQVQVDAHRDGRRLAQNVMYMRSWRHDGSAWHVVESHGILIP